jgi:hypothetical protein
MSFELTFVGGTPIRYRRKHSSYEAAEAEAHRVLHEMTWTEDSPIPVGASQSRQSAFQTSTAYERAAHPAIICGPGCGADGTTIR